MDLILSTGETTAPSWRRRLTRSAFGEATLAPLAVSQAIAAIADAFVTVSLAGSLFFNLSPDASREQVLLYLIVTVSPLAVLAPLIGPAVDRFRHRQRLVASLCYGLRALMCLLLAATLFQLSFYGFALGLLIAGKASGIVKQALVPMLVTDPDRLVSANAQLARMGTIAGAVGGAIGLPILQAFEADVLLRVAAVVYACSALVIWRARISPAGDTPLSDVEYAETHSPSVLIGSIGFMAIRAAVGFFVFMLAFTLRRESEPVWVYGAAVVLYGGGAFVGNVVAPLLRRRFSDQQLIALALAGPAVPTLIGILGVSRPLLFAIAALIGLSTTLGRHGFDSLLQHRAPAALRGRAAARYETRFQLVWALGAVVATPITLPAEASMAVLTVLYIPALAVFVRASIAARAFERQAGRDIAGRAGARLAAAAESLAAGLTRVTIIDAATAVDLASLGNPAVRDLPELAAINALRQRALDAHASIDDDDALDAMRLAETLLAIGPAEASAPEPPAGTLSSS